MRRAKKSKQEERSLEYDPDLCGVSGKAFVLKEDLTHICDCYTKGAKGVVICSWNDGTAKVCFECLHTDTLPKKYLLISMFPKRITRRPAIPSRPKFEEDLIQVSRLVKKKTFKLIPKQKNRLIPK